jgi:hypothetical protein
LRPVGSLESLVELDIDMLLEQRSQSDGVLARQLGGEARVEQIPALKPVVAVEYAEIVVSIVKDDLDLWILEYDTNWIEVLDRKRINQGSLGVSANLYQINAIHVPVKGRGLGIERNSIDGCEPGHEAGQCILVSYEL